HDGLEERIRLEAGQNLFGRSELLPSGPAAARDRRGFFCPSLLSRPAQDHPAARQQGWRRDRRFRKPPASSVAEPTSGEGRQGFTQGWTASVDAVVAPLLQASTVDPMAIILIAVSDHACSSRPTEKLQREWSKA